MLSHLEGEFAKQENMARVNDADNHTEGGQLRQAPQEVIVLTSHTTKG